MPLSEGCVKLKSPDADRNLTAPGGSLAATQDHLTNSAEVAHQAAACFKRRPATYSSVLKAQAIKYYIGDEVLNMLPTIGSVLELPSRGPYGAMIVVSIWTMKI